jgi:hypothetical protein
MKLLYFFILSLVNANNKVIINNKNTPVCRNCIHFQPYNYGEFSSTLSKCNKFADKDLKTDEIIFDYADLCRLDQNKCGKEGKYFEVEPNLQRKIFIHYILNKIPVVLLISLNAYTFFYLYVTKFIDKN